MSDTQPSRQSDHHTRRSSIGLRSSADVMPDDVRQWHWYPHRWAGGAFAVDYVQLRSLLPAPPVHPLRLSRNRALVCAWGAYVREVGHEPPCFGYGEVALMALVTCGDKPAPPLLPGLGRRAMTRHGFGFFPVMTVVTNPLAAEMYERLLGIAASVADIRVEQRADRERFVCEADGRLVWDLTVRSDGRPAADRADSCDWFYTAQGGDIYRSPIGGSGVSRSRFGRDAATVSVGDHPIADQVRGLGLSRAWAGEFVPDRHLWLSGAPEWIGSADTGLEPMPARIAARARLLVSPAPGVEFEVDQVVDGPGWDPADAFTGTGRGPEHQRSER